MLDGVLRMGVAVGRFLVAWDPRGASARRRDRGWCRMVLAPTLVSVLPVDFIVAYGPPGLGLDVDPPETAERLRDRAWG